MTFMNVQYKSTRLFSILVLKCKKNQGKVSVQTIVKLKDVLYILVHHINDATSYSSCISKFYLILVGKLCIPPPH